MPDCPKCGAGAPESAAFCAACGARLNVFPSEAKPPSRPTDDLDALRARLTAALAPQYEVLRLLGIGGMGAVFLAREPALKRLVAVKTLFPHLAEDEDFRARFAREGRAAAALSHPNVVRVYTVGEMVDPPMPYIIMHYVEGPSLAAWIKDRADEGRAVDEREARRIVGEVASALAAAHARGLVHRDIKPGNVLMETESGRAFVADFGLTAVPEASEEDARAVASEKGAILGTPAYMSPEQAAGGPVGPPSDLYSVGMLAYELLTGAQPFSASNTAGWISAHLNERAAPLRARRPDLSPEVTQLIDRCLAKRPEDRPSAPDVQRGLLPTLETEIAWPPPGMHAFRRVARRLVVLSIATILSGLLLVVALARPPTVLRLQGNWWDLETAGGWQIALLLVAGAFGISSLALLVVLARAAADGIQHRRVGWKWRTVWDAAADPDGRSGLLVAGGREFASLTPDRRKSILSARRTTLATLQFGGFWIPVAMGGWSVLVVLGFIGLDGTGPTLGLGVRLLFALPVILAAAAAAWSAAREWRLLGPLPRRRSHTGTVAAAAASHHAVADWYKFGGARKTASDETPATPSSVDDPVTEEMTIADLDQLQSAEQTPAVQPETPATPVSTPAPSLRKRQWTAGAAMAATIVVWLALATGVAAVVASAFVAARTVRGLGPDTKSLASLLKNVQEGRDPLQQAMRATQPYLPAPDTVADGAVRAWIHAVIGDGRASVALAAYAEPPSTGVLRLANLVTTSASTGLSADSNRLFAELDSHPRTALFRRIARAARADIFAAVLDRPLTLYGSRDAVPIVPATAALREAGAANALAGIGAVARRDFTSAENRFGENAAFARHLLRVPNSYVTRVHTLAMLRDFALRPLAELENSRGHTQQGESLREAADDLGAYMDAEYWPKGMQGLAANPRNLASYRNALGNVHMPPGFRIGELEGVWDGFCANPREILSGVSARRSAAVFAAADSISDVASARALAELSERAWITATAEQIGVASSQLDLNKRDVKTMWRRLRVCWLKLARR